MSPKLPILFSTGFHWRIFFFHGLLDFVLFSVLAWGTRVSHVSVNLFVFSPEQNGYGSSARYEPSSKTDFLLFTSAEGKGAPLPFWGPSQSFGFSLFPLPMSGDLRSLSANTWSPLRDPHSLLTVTFWLLDSADSPRENSISLTSSSPWAITWQYLPLTNCIFTFRYLEERPSCS